MARLTQRARIEHVAQTIFDRMLATDSRFSLAEAREINEGVGWTYAEPRGVEDILVEGVRLTDWELTQAYTLVTAALARGDSWLSWTDPRKTGRPRIYDEPLSGILLELPPALLDAIETARGETTTRREWIETAIRQRLERDSMRGEDA